MMEKDLDHDAISELSESLQVILTQPAKQEQYYALSRLAASLERQADYVSASQQWIAASYLAPSGVERHWCQSRAHLCDRRVGLRSNTK